MLWQLVLSGCFGSGVGNSEERIEVARLALLHRLDKWYKDRHALGPTENLTRISDLTRKMMGESGGKQLKVKGAESWGVLLFLVDVGNAIARRLNPEIMRTIEAGQCLIDLVTCFHTNGLMGPRMPSDQIDLCYSLYSRYLTLTDNLPALVFPKRHVVCHAIERLDDQGNPKFFGNWHDEALNKVLKAACRNVSQVTFEPSLLRRMRPLLAKNSKKRGIFGASV